MSLDKTPTLDVLVDVINTYNYKNNNIILLQPTSPFRKIKTFNDIFDKFNKFNDTVCTIKKVSNPRFGTINNNIYSPVNYKLGDRSKDIKSIYR